MTESSDMSSDEFDENVHESDGLSFDENDFESAELSSRDGADHGNGVFLKLEDVSISTANSGSGKLYRTQYVVQCRHHFIRRISHELIVYF